MVSLTIARAVENRQSLFVSGRIVLQRLGMLDRQRFVPLDRMWRIGNLTFIWDFSQDGFPPRSVEHTMNESDSTSIKAFGHKRQDTHFSTSSYSDPDDGADPMISLAPSK